MGQRPSRCGQGGPVVGIVWVDRFEEPQLDTTGCTPIAPITVPVPAMGNGKKQLRMKVSPSNDPITGKKRPVDTDALTLICKRHP